MTQNADEQRTVTKPTMQQAGLIGVAVLGLALLFGLPHILSPFGVLQITVYFIFAILALSLAFVFGFGGILCLGQAAFFGIGAYAYTIAAINLPGTTSALLLALIAPALFAAALGYFIFYGRITDVYVGVITLTVTLILYSLMNSTAGPDYRIGKALLGGINGIPAVPKLEWPFQPGARLAAMDIFRVTLVALMACYFGLRALLHSRFGRIVIAVRENERRAELLGYDVRLVKLVVFMIGAVMAGLAGMLHANWGSFVGPNVFGVMQSAQVLVWVMVGGTGTLFGPIIGCIIMLWISNQLGSQQYFNSSVLLGATLVVFVMLLPAGLLPNLQKLANTVWSKAFPGARG